MPLRAPLDRRKATNAGWSDLAGREQTPLPAVGLSRLVVIVSFSGDPTVPGGRHLEELGAREGGEGRRGVNPCPRAEKRVAKRSQKGRIFEAEDVNPASKRKKLLPKLEVFYRVKELFDGAPGEAA
jgi:hypothetical protein